MKRSRRCSKCGGIERKSCACRGKSALDKATAKSPLKPGQVVIQGSPKELGKKQVLYD